MCFKFRFYFSAASKCRERMSYASLLLS